MAYAPISQWTVPATDRLGLKSRYFGQAIPRSGNSHKIQILQVKKIPITASVSEKIPQSNKSPPAPLKDVPGTYGPPLIGAIRDRQEYFQGTEEFFRKRIEKYQSTVFRVNMPPGPPFFPDPRVIILLDAKSFPVLFDVTKVEKKNLFTGTFMPSTEFTGGYRTLSYLDPSEENHAKLKNFCFEVLKMNRDRWLPEFNKATSELWAALEDDLAKSGRAGFSDANEQMAFNFLCRSVLDRDPAAPGPASLGTDGPSLIKKWVFLQLAPIQNVGLPKPVEFVTHTVPLPFRLVRKDYERVFQFFKTHGTRALDEASRFGVSRDEACHNLLFNICFNTWGGILILFPSIVRHIARGGAHLHSDLAEEVRGAVKSAGGRLTMRALESMPLLRSTVYEIMRIAPPVPFQYGRAKEDLAVESHGCSFAVKKGELLAGYQPFATRDPKVFEKPEQFVPDRFLGEQGEKLLKYVLWSNGPETENPTPNNKQCAGKDFVTMIARLFVAELFLRYDSFDIEISDGSAVTFTSLKKATS